MKTTILSYLLVPHYHLVFSPRIWPIFYSGLDALVRGVLLFYIRLRPSDHVNILASSLHYYLSFSVDSGRSIFEPTNALSKIYTDPLLLEFASGVILGVIYLDGGIVCRHDLRS